MPIARVLRCCRFLSIAVSLAMAIAARAWAGPIEDCDRLAAEPGEGGAGIALDAVDATAALPACAAAITADPLAPRLKHQYARALERAGERAEALRLYQWAADDGYAPAEAALGRLSSAPPSQAEDSAAADEETRKLADLYEGIAASLRTYIGTLPPDPRERVHIIAETGTDPDAILAWVSANTRLIPYRGLLRDAEGVLLDRSGNSLDRALLLARLLGDAGFEVRLARAELSADQARALLGVTPAAANPPRLPPGDRASRVTMLASDARVPRADVEALVDRRLADEAKVEAERQDLIATVGDAVVKAMAPHEAALTTSLVEGAIEVVRDHWWVQSRTATGWRDLDPDGITLGALQAKETLPVDNVPSELRHAVVIKVVAEVTKAEGRQEVVLLSEEVKPTEMLGTPIQLVHRALSMRPMAEYLASNDPTAAMKEMREAALNERAWLPVLRIGARDHLERFFTASGETPTASGKNLAARGLGVGFGAILGQLDQVLGSALDAPEDQSKTQEPTAAITAEWIEIELRLPDAPTIRHRRQIFDLVGPSERAAASNTPVIALTDEAKRARAEALLGTQQIAVFGAQPSNVDLTRRMLTQIADFSAHVASAVRVADPAERLEQLSHPEPFAPYLPLSYAIDRGDAAPVRPNVVIVHDWVRFEGDGVRYQTTFDIVENAASGASLPSAGARLMQGVADTATEAAVLQDAINPANTAQAHASDLKAGRSWLLLDPAAPAPDQLSSIGGDDRARIQEALSQGAYVLVRATPESNAPAWWRIDPATGMALGIGANGYGTAMTERSAQIAWYDKVACGFSLVGMGVAIVTGGDKTLGFITLAMCAFGPGASKATGSHGLGKGIAAVGSAVDALEMAFGEHGGHGDHGGGEH